MLSPSSVKTLLAPELAIELIATVTDLNVLSPAKNVVPLLSLAGLELRRARGTVPDERLDAFNDVI